MSRLQSANTSGSSGSRQRSPLQPAPNTRPKSREPDPRFAFRSALGRYKTPILQAIRLTVGPAIDPLPSRATALVDEISDYLDRVRDIGAAFQDLPSTSAFVPPLFAVTEITSMSLAGLRHALGILKVEPDSVILALLQRGLLALDLEIEQPPIEDLASTLTRCDATRTGLLAHPSLVRHARTPRLDFELPALPGERVSQVRETDGLEPMLRLGALWQLIGAAPLRQTQQGTLYKRDRDRLDENPVLNATSPDSPIEVANISSLWMALAIRVGLVEIESSGERLQACPPEFWSENSVHLHQMIATSWLGLRSWQELETELPEGEFAFPPLAIGYARLPILIWLGSLAEGDWIALEDLATHLTQTWPGWDRLTFLDASESVSQSKRLSGPRKAKSPPESNPPTAGIRLLEALLLNLAFRMGLVRVGEEKIERRKVVQLTPLGRYALSLGPPAPSHPALDHFLFVQPNFELIAYRQGLTPRLIGRLSQFAQWSNIGAAIELKLTNESVVVGLDAGMSAEQMLETLSRHSSRPVPTGIIDALKSWATRRDRVTCYANATLIEFASRRDLEQALSHWPGEPTDRSFPVAISDRLLLVEDDRAIPFDRLKLVGSRDYRHPPESCLIVDHDGTSITLDPTKADLLVDAELTRFTDEIVLPQKSGESERNQAQALRRRFAISLASLERAIEAGMTEGHFADWFIRRTGEPIPAAIRLMLLSRLKKIPKLQTARLLVLTTPTPEILDGLLQHPDTRDLLGDRLGETTVIVSEDRLPALSEAVSRLGVELSAPE